ncbi:MEDS domain-containing protein [Halomicrococcus sp. NG-SE-24]|uniref:MEDS domain-containing protein n=1 Tax=Halomicrococcus sp. NG-SE-24 TaxID=3436928 RepID=UPI003D95663F
MSKNAQPTIDRQGTVGLESGLDALRNSPTFRGPVEPLDGHHSNDHLALVYETREEQLEAVVPFVEQGLERDERCMYIADENSEAEIIAAMRRSDVDVDAALESGALTLHSKQDTYCRDGGFDPDEMIAFLSESIEEAIEEYEALRIAGEMTWIFGDDPEIEDLIEYEGKLNRLIPDEDCIALCQYNRERFPPEILRDIVRTHPHLVYDNTVCHNCYYTPPEEFFGPDRPARETTRMLETLRERTQATVQLRQHERQLQRQNNRLESFASMLAHELRNPLHIAQMYLHEVGGGNPDAVTEIERALDRIEEMIDILLITARTTDAAIDRDTVALAEAATEVWTKVAAPSSDLVVETERTVSADSVHIWHLLENLFKNAVEHGGADVTVRIGDLADADGFYVADDGPGIPDADREAVLEAGCTTASNGIGLGLTFVSQLAAAYAWDCTLTESRSGGARFEFRNVECAAPSR